MSHRTGDGPRGRRPAARVGALLGALLAGESDAQDRARNALELAPNVYWQQLVPRVRPVARMVCAMVYDPKRDACVLMGGRGYIPPYRYVDANGERSIALPIPAEPAIVGYQFFVQLFTSDPLANATGTELSETRQGTIGRR